MFLNEDYLLKSETAKILYHDYMKTLPIYDYHCHIDPKEIAENKRFEDLTEVLRLSLQIVCFQQSLLDQCDNDNRKSVKFSCNHDIKF